MKKKSKPKLKRISELPILKNNIWENGSTFFNLFNESSDPILLLSENQFFDCNKATVKLFGYLSKVEFIPCTPSILSPIFQPDGRLTIELLEEMLGIAHKNGSHQFEMSYQNLKGSNFVFEVMLSKIIVENEVVFHVLLRDISKRKSMEHDLILAKKVAEHATALQNSFISNLSHEIRTPLNGILGFTEVLRDSFDESENKFFKHIFETMDLLSKKLLRIIDMTLRIAQLQIGNHPYNPAIINVTAIVENIVNNYTKAAEDKSINIYYSNVYGDIYILHDEYCFTQSLSNLIDNALKYTNQGFVKVFISYDLANHLLINVEDSGIGISEEYKNEIFLPFSQEEIGYTRIYEGIGLALTLTKRLLELNHSELSFNSEKGKGSCFTISIKPENIVNFSNN